MAGISASAAAYYNSLGVSNGSDWISSTESSIKSSMNQAGMMGALNSLAGSGGSGSISSFLGQSSSFANNFATIAQNSVINYGSYYGKLAADNQQAAAQKKLQDAMNALNSAQQKPPPSQLSDFIYLKGGVSIDTKNNIMTMSNGTQIDITTGTKVVDPANTIQMANGSYLNTQTNILTLSDGTQIDTVTGLTVNTSV